MDQEPLVSEQKDAARKFIDELAKHVPVRAAFWLKADEESHWYLYIATDRDRNGSSPEDYDVVVQVSNTIDDPNFDSSRVTLIGLKDPLARAALEMYQRYPQRIPIHRWAETFGRTYVQGLYLYPPPVSPLNTSDEPASELPTTRRRRNGTSGVARSKPARHSAVPSDRDSG
jgi:hypothetical protein